MTEITPEVIEAFTAILRAFLIGWFITSFEPLKNLLDKIKIPKWASMITHKLTGCTKCAAFWTALILSHSLYIAIVAAIAGYLWDKYDTGIKL